MDALIAKARKEYHSELLHRGVLAINAQGIATNADKDSVASVSIARGIADRLLAETDERIAGQTSGKAFEEITMMFIKSTFPKLQHLRPGKWEIKKLGNRSKIKTSAFAQYEHLAYLTELTKTSVYKGYKQDKIEMMGDRAEMSDFPLYLNTVAGGLDRRDQTIGGFSFVVKIYAVPVVEIIG